MLLSLPLNLLSVHVHGYESPSCVSFLHQIMETSCLLSKNPVSHWHRLPQVGATDTPANKVCFGSSASLSASSLWQCTIKRTPERHREQLTFPGP